MALTRRQRAYILSMHRHNGDLEAVAADMGVAPVSVRNQTSRPGPVREAWIRTRRCLRCGGPCDRVPPASNCLACHEGHHEVAAERDRSEAERLRQKAAEADRLRGELAQAEAEIERLLAVNARLRRLGQMRTYRALLVGERRAAMRTPGLRHG